MHIFNSQCLVSLFLAIFHELPLVPHLRHIVTSTISISVNAYVLPVAVIGETLERIAGCGTVGTSSCFGNEKEVAGPDGCKSFTLISLFA